MVEPPKDDELKPDSAPTPLPVRGGAKVPSTRGTQSPDEETVFLASASETRVDPPEGAPTPPSDSIRSAETQAMAGRFVKREIEKLFDTSMPLGPAGGDPRRSEASTGAVKGPSGEPPDTERPTQWMRPGPKPEGELPESDRETATRFGGRTGSYKLVSLIGRGGGGEVWEAEQGSLGRIVAVKRMHRGRIEPADTGGGALSPSHPSATGSGGDIYFRRLFAFQQEALIGGALEHPNILPVYDLGQDEEGAPLIAMRRVRGRSWARLMAEEMATTPAEDFINRHVGILVQVAQGVAFAHSRGIIHRDIKPTQVMIGEYGEVQLMDWGLAVVLDPALLPPEWRPDEAPLEPTVAVATNPAGTPAFMAPEQARVGTDGLGPWTDVFLLGATLFYVLTGEPPNTGRSSPQVVLQAAKGQYRNLKEVAGARPVPAQLAALVADAMEVDWKRRRMTARDFARRLTDFLLGYSRRPESEALADQAEELLGRDPLEYKTLAAALTTLVTARGLWPGNPRLDALRNRALSLYAREALGKGDLILARVQAERLPAGPERAGLLVEVEEAEGHRARREAERRRAIVAAGVLMVGLVLSLGAAVWQWTRAQRELVASKQANATIRAKEAAATAARDAMEHEAYFSGIGFAAASIRDGNPDKALETLVRRVPEHLRAWEWGALAGMLNSDDATLMRGVVTRQNSALFHSDIAPDGATIAVAASRGVVMIWDMGTLRPLRQFTLPTRGVWCVDHSPDGSRLLAAGLDGKGFIIDTVTGDILCELPVHRGVQSPILRGAAWSPDGTMVATSGNTTPVTVTNPDTGEVVIRHWVEAGTYDVAWSPDSRHIAVATRSPVDPFVLDVATGEVAFTMPGDLRTVLSVNYSPDGRLVAVATVGGRVSLYSAIDGARVREIGHLHTSVRSVAFTPDSQLLAAVGARGHIWLHDVASGRLVHELIGARQMEKLAFHPTRNLLVGTAFDELKIWNLDRVLPRRMADDRPPAEVVARSARMRLMSFPGERSTVWQGYDDQWIGGRGRTVLRAEDELAIVDSFYTATSPDGHWRVDVGYEDRTLRLYDNQEDEFIADLMTAGRAFFADFTPDGQWLAVSMRAGEVRFLHTSNWREEPRRMIRLVNPNDIPFSLAFTQDGLLAVGGALGALEVRDFATGEQLWYRATAHDRAKAIVKAAFSPDGGRLATASSDETARIWDARTGELLMTLAGHGLNVLSVAWHPDGNRLLTVGMDDTAKLWDTESGREIVTLLITQGQTRLMGGTFSPDGDSAFIATSSGTVTRIDTLAWQDRLAQCGEADELLRCIELVKRQTRLNPATTEADILW